VSKNKTEFSDLKVMVIDDSKTIRRSAETLLKKAGCEVITAENGFEALPIISAEHPDILFIDIMMPRLDGYQTCSLVKSNPKFSNIPIVMLSSKDGLFDRAKGRVVGAEEYLTKPFTREDLLGTIRTQLLSNDNDEQTTVIPPVMTEPPVSKPEPELTTEVTPEPLEIVENNGLEIIIDSAEPAESLIQLETIASENTVSPQENKTEPLTLEIN